MRSSPAVPTMQLAEESFEKLQQSRATVSEPDKTRFEPGEGFLPERFHVHQGALSELFARLR